MSWASDVRCLYCDGKLPLYRKITNGQFCSTPHRKLYWQEQERLGVERLHQTHDSLRAIRPPEGVQAILGNPMAEPSPSGSIAFPLEPAAYQSQSYATGDAYAFESELQPHVPLWAPQIAAGDEIDAPAPLAGLVRVYALPQAQWPQDWLRKSEPNSFPGTVLARMPLCPKVSTARGVTAAGFAKVPVEPRVHEEACRAEPMQTVMLPCRD